MSTEQITPAAFRGADAFRYVGLGKSTVYALIADGKFPKPVKLSPGRVVFMRDDLDAFLANCRESSK